jgi:hypothetical protein
MRCVALSFGLLTGVTAAEAAAPDPLLDESVDVSGCLLGVLAEPPTSADVDVTPVALELAELELLGFELVFIFDMSTLGISSLKKKS